MPTTYTNRSVSYVISFDGAVDPMPIVFQLNGFSPPVEQVDDAMLAFVDQLHTDEPINNVTRTFGATGTDGDPWYILS